MKPKESIDALTGLRGVAAWWVVFYHFREALDLEGLLGSIFSGGYLAVDLFFVLSGFVLFVSYGDNFSDGLTGQKLRLFYLRRLARIYPLHLFLMLMFLLNPFAIYWFSSQRDFGGRYDVGYFLQSLLLIQNWGWTSTLRWNIPAWSISVEWFASLVFPFAVLLFARVKIEELSRSIALVLLMCFALYFVYCWGGYASIGDAIPRLGLYRCVFEFVIGMVAGSLFLHYGRSCEKYSLIFIVASVVILVGSWMMSMPDYGYIPFVSFLLVLGLSSYSGFIAKTLSIRLLIRLGEASYSTYLVHFFCKDWIKFFTDGVGGWVFFGYVSMVLAVSFFLYYFIEIPFKKLIYAKLEATRGA